MSFQEFVHQFAPVVQVYGEDNFPLFVLERIHYRVKNLPPEQFRELMGLIIDTCKYTPKVPEIIELMNQVRNRHRADTSLPEVQREEPSPETKAMILEFRKKLSKNTL